MTHETRRRQMREALMAKARQMQEADRQRRIETVKRISESVRAISGPYSPERSKAQLRDLFGDGLRKAKIGE